MIREEIKALAACLDKAGIMYMVMGGQAVLLYGEARFTQDIDITVALIPDEAGTLISTLNACGFMPVPEDVDGFIQKTWVLPVRHANTGVSADIVFSILPFERDAMESARIVDMDGVPVRYIPVESLIAQKLLAGRPRDVEDVEGILDVQGGKIDKERVSGMLEGLGREIERPDLVETWARIIGGKL